MQISVIIPTYNRPLKLKKCLQALAHQTLSQDEFEVIVIDDGSFSENRQILKNLTNHGIQNFSLLEQSNQGQGPTRNHGVEHAQGSIIILIGDDIICSPTFLEKHLAVHQKHPKLNVAGLGKIKWEPNLELTPLMQWLTHGSSILGRYGGHQFAYEKLSHRKWADYNFFYTSNISLKKELLEKYPFDPAFARYGWEDIELGYRLTQKAGLKIYYEPEALVYHNHLITLEDFEKRMRAIGAASHIIHQKYPELNKVPSPLKRFIFKLLSHKITLGFFKLIQKIAPKFGRNYHFYALSKKYYLEGLNSSSTKPAPPK